MQAMALSPVHWFFLRSSSRFIILALLLGCSRPASSQLKVSGFFGDHMVVQRSQPITVWGSGTPGAEVAVTLSDKTASAKAGTDGRWQASLPAMTASGPFELKVRSGAEAHTLKDVMVGDVWLISGQSNVVLTLAASTDWAQAKTEPNSDEIRVCKLPGNYAFEPTDDFSRPIAWNPMVPAKVGSYLSGVGYYFIRGLQPKVGVTVGLVQAAAGGTQIEQWVPEAALKADDPQSPLFEMRDKARAKLAADAKAKVGPIEAGANTMYNGTIYPFRLAKFKGVLWYQGEANSRSKRDYLPQLRTFVRSWRETFAQPDLPFILVQLPKFGLPKDDGWMRVQEAQLKAARELGLALVVTIDEGSATTIHPPNKAEVGRRAALAALQHVYKQDVEGSSPLPKTVSFAGGSTVVEFEGFKGDLVLKGDALQGFELAEADGKFQPATATIEGRRVVVKSAAVAAPTAVRYLWANSPESVTLYSAAGLPASPFRWPTETEQRK